MKEHIDKQLKVNSKHLCEKTEPFVYRAIHCPMTVFSFRNAGAKVSSV